MYKAKHTKKLYLAVETFNKARKDIKVYHTGYRFFETDDMKVYSLVLGAFRIMIGRKKAQMGHCAG